ncbi:Phytochelatin synthase-domain-containing protein [Fimicolochytrium jonesii]|uniref:Phytochelatin synthase-domain-containing protein n=1 Tax=Fimicolochytrium jonesii TaxID=1396493 RepID=UPI0022FF0688|nr:Phytochelatin synthase-domain-containing protein [Fimicolochytrium jonesii]KAI8825914.1 Phytochelatin synthase-domain-containing protein [Fimicolochytrium jonesii]
MFSRRALSVDPTCRRLVARTTDSPAANSAHRRRKLPTTSSSSFRVVCTSSCARQLTTTTPKKASHAPHPAHNAAPFCSSLPYSHVNTFTPPSPPTSNTTSTPQQRLPRPKGYQSPSPAVSKANSPAEDVLSKTFYRRELPSNLHSFTSDAGRKLFKECLQTGNAEIYFSLSGNFTMQSEPAYCGLGSLAMVLNALAVDPGRRWKGVWRWYSDDMLECCAPREQIREKGMTFREFACLARCNGLRVVAKRADQVTREEFLEDLKQVTASEDTHMVVSFSRGKLNQTGDGHFSPIGAFHPEKNQALILDTARFKYPSYFCDANLLYDAMHPIDKETGLPRGYFILSKGQAKPLSLCKISSEKYDWPALTKLFTNGIPQTLSLIKDAGGDADSLAAVFRHILSSLPDVKLISLRQPGVDLAGPTSSPSSNAPSNREATNCGPSRDLASMHESEIRRLLQEAILNPLFPHVRAAFESSPTLHSAYLTPTPTDPTAPEKTLALATIFLLAAPRELYATISPDLFRQLAVARDRTNLTPLLRGEVERISEQLELMLNSFCKCGKRVQACGRASAL